MSIQIQVSGCRLESDLLSHGTSGDTKSGKEPGPKERKGRGLGRMLVFTEAVTRWALLDNHDSF